MSASSSGINRKRGPSLGKFLRRSLRRKDSSDTSTSEWGNKFQRHSDKLPEHWPFEACNNSVIYLHVYSAHYTALVHDDEVHLCIVQEDNCIPGLVLRYNQNSKAQDLCISRQDFGCLLTMACMQNAVLRGDADCGLFLKVALVAVEDGMQRLSWDIEDLANGSLARSIFMCIGTPSRVLHFGDQDILVHGCPEHDQVTSTRALTSPVRTYCRVMNRDVTDVATSRHRYQLPREVQIEAPHQIADIATNVVSSAVATLLGVRDRRGTSVVVIHTDHRLWHDTDFNPSELTKLLLYYYSIHKEETRKRGLTVIVDARSGALIPVVSTLLDVLYAVEASKHGALSVVHVIADKHVQSLLFKSSAYKPHQSPKFDMLSSVEKLYKYIDKGLLPPELGGSFSISHPRWVQFRTEVERLTIHCQVAARFLVGIMQEMSDYGLLPRTVAETDQLIDQHENCIKKAFDDPRLTGLQQDEEAFAASLKNYQQTIGTSEDYRESVASARHFYKDVQDTVVKLVKLADTRLHKLEQCRQLRQFEDDTSQIISWISMNGEDSLKRHKRPAETMKGIRSQKKDFEQFYFSAMTFIDKGSDLLEEASMLTQSGSFGEAIGVKDVSKTLKKHLQLFSSRLEETREKIEDTSNCYQLLDRAYEWALEAMKHVASIKLDSNPTSQQVNRLLRSAEFYLRNHPPITATQFDKMINLARKVHNDKLFEQCNMARTRCEETDNLMQLRLQTLRKAKEQLEKDERKRVHKHRSRRSQVLEDNLPVAPLAQLELDDLQSNVSDDSDRMTSTPVHAASRRRSYAGTTSNSLYSSSAPTQTAFLSSIAYADDSYFENMITDDMSDRVVATFPAAVAANARLRGSRDSLNNSMRGSKESLRSGSSESLSKSSDSLDRIKEGLRRSMDNLVDNIKASRHSLRCSRESLSLSLESLTRRKGNSLPEEGGGSRSKRSHKPRRKMFKRSNTAMAAIGSEIRNGMGKGPADVDLASGAESKPRWSLNTGSTESLPSMPEMNEDDCASVASEGDVEKMKSWSPVPVNSHLMQQSKSMMHHGSMADLRLTEAEIKSRRVLAHVMEEMVQTERDYVRSLQYIIDHYIPEVMREDVPQVLRGKRNIIFGNIEKIYQFHSQYFLNEVEQCENAPFQICHAFLAHENEFYLYALYNKNKPKSDALMADCGSAFFMSKQLELCDKMDLASYLLKPVQRMGKYALLLRQIIKECPDSEPDLQDLLLAEEMVKFQLRHGNDLLAMDSLRECDVNLQEQGRLLRQDKFLVWQGRKKSLRHVFLFEDMILFSKTRHSPNGHDTYIYKSSIKTSDLGLTETIGDTGYKFEIWFRRRGVGDTYILQAPTVEMKNSWTKEISKILWKQAMRNRELRMTEMSSMGIGSKPCLDLKPSDDNICNRSIDVSAAAKTRYRNSIAVSSANYMKGQKRPHSIVSVSSSSSSNSSHSNGQHHVTQGFPGQANPLTGHSGHSTNLNMFGMFNLAFDPTDRPHLRTLTLSSNESGICPDLSMEFEEEQRVRKGSIVSQGDVTALSPCTPRSNSIVSQGEVTSLSPGRSLSRDDSMNITTNSSSNV